MINVLHLTQVRTLTASDAGIDQTVHGTRTAPTLPTREAPMQDFLRMRTSWSMHTQETLSSQQALGSYRTVKIRGSAFSTQSAHKQQRGSQFYAPAKLYSQKIIWYLFLFNAE